MLVRITLRNEPRVVDSVQPGRYYCPL